MAFLGLRTQDAGLGENSTASLLIKALTGDPEREMALARGRSDLELDAYRQRQMEAAAAQYQAEADTKAWELNQRQTNLPTMADFFGGLVEPPVPVEQEVVQPVEDWAEPAPVDTSGLDTLGFATAPPLPPEGPTGGHLPVAPVEGYPSWTDLAPREPYGEPAPVESVVDPAEQAAYEREVAAAKARAGLIIGGGGNAAQMAQGLGIGEGIVKTGSDDPAVRSQGNVLYTGTNPPEATAAPGASPYLKQELEMRNKLMGTDAFKQLAAISPVYMSMMRTAGGPLDEGALLDLVYGLATAEDPGSVVRESDSIQVKRIGGLSGEMQSVLSYVTGGEPLSAPTVAKIMRIAGNRYKSYKQAWDWQAKSAADIATRSGFDTRNAIPTFEELGEHVPPPPVDPAKAAAADEKYPG